MLWSMHQAKIHLPTKTWRNRLEVHLRLRLRIIAMELVTVVMRMDEATQLAEYFFNLCFIRSTYTRRLAHTVTVLHQIGTITTASLALLFPPFVSLMYN